jgi:hypothetical protein
MKISNEPTPYLLLKAGTDSAWDCCDFAIVYLSKRVETDTVRQAGSRQAIQDDISFQSLNFYDISVGFYQSGRGRDTGQRGLAGRQ